MIYNPVAAELKRKATALETSAGRLPVGVDPATTVYLKSWPNLTRLHRTPHALRIADLGWKDALRRDVHLAQGLNVWNGKVTFEAVAEAVGTDYVPVDQALA